MRSYSTTRSGAHLRRQPENQICRYHTEASTTSPESYVACLYRPSGVLTGFGFVFERHTSGLLLAHAPETVFTHSPISFSFHYTSSHFSSPVCSDFRALEIMLFAWQLLAQMHRPFNLCRAQSTPPSCITT